MSSFLLLPTAGLAQEDANKYDLCIIWGVASGADDSFIRSLVNQLLIQRGIARDDNICTSLKQIGYRQSREKGQMTDLEPAAEANWMLYQNFRDEVMAKLIKQLDL